MRALLTVIVRALWGHGWLRVEEQALLDLGFDCCMRTASDLLLVFGGGCRRATCARACVCAVGTGLGLHVFFLRVHVCMCVSVCP